MKWQLRAACLEADPELFFPSHGGHYANRAIREAKEFCSRCPVTEECLQYAIEYEEDIPPSDWVGVYGGLTHKERELKTGKRTA